MTLKESPSQTAGPYVHIGCVPSSAGLEQRHFGAQLGDALAAQDKAITIDITVLDGEDALVKDALIEMWEPENQIWSRQPTDLTTGRARFQTQKPVGTDQAPHVLLWIVARGINLALTTRLYFPDENNSSDPVYQLAGDRASTLLATKSEIGYAHTVRLQGTNETVFFDV